MKLSGKMCLMITLKVTINEGFTLSLEETFFGKSQEGSNFGVIVKILGRLGKVENGWEM